MTMLTKKVFLASALAAFGVGCAGASDDSSQQKQVDDALATAAENGESFENAAKVAEAEVDETPATALATSEGQPTVAYLKGRGPHPTASFNTSGSGKNYGGSTVYYPKDSSTDLTGLVMCPGYTAKKSSLAGWGPFLASHGIVFMAMDTKTTGDQVVQRAPQIQQALRDLKEMNTSRSELKGRFGNKWAVSGWSMGGGGTWITASSAASNLGIKAAITLAGHNMTAGGAAGVGAGRIRIPTLMMNGSTDATLLGGLGQTSSAYNAIPGGTPKMMWETGTCGHFCWGDPNAGNKMSGVLLVSWLKTFVEEDTRFKALLNCQSAQGGNSRTTSCKTAGI